MLKRLWEYSIAIWFLIVSFISMHELVLLVPKFEGKYFLFDKIELSLFLSVCALLFLISVYYIVFYYIIYYDKENNKKRVSEVE